MFRNDYIMRQIENIIRFIAKILFNKDFIVYEFPEKEGFDRTDYIYKDILIALENGDLNKAENLLFENINYNDDKYMEIALDFYRRIKILTDEELDNYGLEDWQKEEVKKGNYDPWNFEEEDLEEDDYYSEDDE